MRAETGIRALLLGLVAACVSAPVAPATPATSNVQATPVAPVLADAAAFERAPRDARSKFIAEDYAGSVEAFRRALAANPGDAQAQYWIARAAVRANDPAGAVAALQQLADTAGDVAPFADHFTELRDEPAY